MLSDQIQIFSCSFCAGTEMVWKIRLTSLTEPEEISAKHVIFKNPKSWIKHCNSPVKGSARGALVDTVVVI